MSIYTHNWKATTPETKIENKNKELITKMNIYTHNWKATTPGTKNCK
jgi:hypothetical protein